MNFDNSMVGMITLWIMMQGEGWKGVMYMGMDSTSIGQQP